MTANPLIPTASQTHLPGGDFRVAGGVVEPSSSGIPQPGTRQTPRTSKGSGVYGAPGAIQPLVSAPVRDYVVILRNESDRDFRMRYLTVEYQIAAHDELVVPWEVMVSFLGSPDVMNLGPRRMDRKNSYEKLRVKYGAYYNDDLWEQNKPRLAAFRVSGERLITVVDDPDGLSINPSTITQQQQIATTAAMEEMQRQMAAMQRLIAQLSGQSQSTGEPSLIPSQDDGGPVDAPVAPDYVPGGITGGIAPEPVAGMTPSMPPTPGAEMGQAQSFVQPVPAIPQGLQDDAPAPDTTPQGATPDTPANQVRIG